MSDLDLQKIVNWPSGRTGIAVIVGRPNVGKSTFLNAVLDFHLCAVSNKPQTTRRSWRGILSDDSSQIIFIDTPGAHVGQTMLGEYMLSVVMDGLRDADVIVCLADPFRACGEEDKLIAERVGQAGKSCILLLNKSDVTTPEQREDTRKFYLERLPEDTKVFETVAQNRDELAPVLEQIRGLLPESPFFYDPEDMTDAFTRDIGSELIREAALELLFQEVPHSLAVEVQTWKETPKKLHVDATIHVERDSQKGIVIGKNGKMLADVRRNAIKALREIVDQHIDLKLYVKVSPDWRNRKSFLKDVGLTKQDK